MFPTLSRRQKAGLAVALAFLLWVPQGISHGDHTMITGHSTFYNGEAYDPCLGSVAGIVRNRVMWFNDQVLVERYGGKGTFIYLTEQGSKDPRDIQLYSEGVYYDFVDPNGAHWHVEESFIIETFDLYQQINPNSPNAKAGYSQNRTYVWTVELSARPVFDDFAGADPHTYYNFLILADTCKMHNSTATYDGEAVHDELSELNDDNGHPNGEDRHQHGRFMVDLWIGKRPTTAPMGSTTVGPGWQSSWAANWGESQASGTNSTEPTSDGPNNGSPWDDDEEPIAPPEDSLP